ncbi:RNA-directed DNA polymerase, eukaryota, reverse transcriptase zinc-binding domain protein [Tanacetum coccineum]
MAHFEELATAANSMLMGDQFLVHFDRENKREIEMTKELLRECRELQRNIHLKIEIWRSNWDGQVVIMGDFNEVRYISERFGSVFNKKGAEVFNNFINSAGLVEVPLGGLSAVALDRFLSDHRPILMREFHGDYGPIPFKFFYYWFELMKKLKMLKDKIRGWINIYKEGVKSGKRTLKSDLNSINAKIDRGKGDDNDINRRLEIIRLIQDIDKVDSMEMAQKEKIKWAIEGDENSKYYHGVINKKRGRCAVRGVLADGMWVDAQNAVKMEFFEHFKVRFGKPGNCGIKLERDFPNRISSYQNEFLESEVTNKEIKEAVWDCGIDKTPGDLVNEIQSAFVKDRQILDGPFILNELMQWCKSKKKQTMVFKVDFEKAYDSIRWDFLDDVMKKFGFGEIWCNWIQSCLQTSRGSVLVNGSPTQEFQFHKGLKQGDPLSPFLFILVMESLHISFQRVVDDGLFKGINLNSSLHLSHLFYADDAIFMGQWNQDNIDTLIHVLDIFHRASGLRINMSKSKLLGICVEANNLKYAAEKIGCSILKTPFTYLGARVGAQMSRINAWKEITDGMVSRLSKWKVKTLSIGGRLTLLKSVLGATPIYHMSIFKAPMKVLQNMEAISARFFNGADLNTRKACSEVEVLKSKGIDLLSFVTPVLGNSMSTSFWDVAWCGNVDLKTLAPRIYDLESRKDIVVASKLAHNDLEIWSWSLDGTGDFSVSSVRRHIDDHVLPSVNKKTIWIKEVPIKINIHAWKVSIDGLPTRFNHSRRGVEIFSIIALV